MSLVDLLVMILVATILITVGIGLMTYLVYKLRYARVRAGEEESEREGGRYFDPYPPPGREEASGETGAARAGEPRGS